MRVTYISDSIIPSRTANSIHVMKMCRAVAKLGHEVTLLVPNRRGDEEQGVDDPYLFYGVDRCFEIRRLMWLPVRGRMQLYGWRAGAVAAKLKPDMVYGRSVFGCEKAAGRGCITVLESHIPVWQSHGKQRIYFERLLQHKAFKKLVVISGVLKQKYLEKGYLNADMIQVAHDGADEADMSAKCESWPGRAGSLQVGYVGQLYEGKGVEIVVELALLHPDVDFHIVGGMESDIRSWRGRSAAKNVRFHGFVSQAKISAYINCLDICLLPNQRVVTTHDSAGGRNISEYTSPLKMFEYMSHEKCIVASDLPVLREVLNEESAILVSPDDVSAWSSALNRAKESEVRDRLSRRAHSVFLDEYTWKRRAELVLSGL